MTVLNDNDEQDANWVCAVADTLKPGDSILLNDRSRSLEVTSREMQEGVGELYPFNQVWLKGNGTEYYLRYSHTHKYHPKIYSKSEYDVRERESGRTEVRTHTGAGRDVLYLETVSDGEIAIVAEQSAEEFIEATVSSESWQPDPDQSDQGVIESDGESLGDCIDCDGKVVRDQQRAICVSCGSWCWLAQWREWEKNDG